MSVVSYPRALALHAERDPEGSALIAERCNRPLNDPSCPGCRR